MSRGEVRFCFPSFLSASFRRAADGSSFIHTVHRIYTTSLTSTYTRYAARYTSNGFDPSPSPSSRSSSRASSVRTYRDTSRTSFSPPHSTSTSPPISSPVESTFSTSTTFIDGLSSYAASSHRASTSATSVYSDIDTIRTKRCGVREESEEEKDDDEDVLSTLVSSYTPNIDLTELSTPRQLSSFPVEFDSAPFVCVLLDSSAPPPSSSSTKPLAPPPFRPSSPVVLTLPPRLSPKDDAAPTPSPTRAKFTSALKSFTRKSHEKPGFFSVPISEAGGLPSSTAVAPYYSGGAAGRGGAGRKLAVKQVAVLTSPSPSSSSLTLRLAPQHSSHSSLTSSSCGSSSSTVSQRRPSHLFSSGASIRTTSTSSSSSSSSSSGAVARPAPIAYAGGRAGAMASRKAGRRLVVVDVDVEGGEAGETRRKVERVKEGGGTTVKGLSAGVGGGRGRVGAAAVSGGGGKKTVKA